MRNTIVGAIFSDCEIFSNLELTQRVYDRLGSDGRQFPLDENRVKSEVTGAVADLTSEVIGNLKPVVNTELTELISEIRQTFTSPTEVKGLLESITALYPQG